MLKRLSFSAATIVAIASLTGCTPPMPPEVKTALLEQNIICEAGEASIYVDASKAMLVDNLNFSLQADCPEASVVLAESPETADLVVTNYAPDFSTGLYTVPFGISAVAIVINTYDIGSISISANSLRAILSGQITNWSDPALVEENPAEILPDLPIVLATEADPALIRVVEQWVSSQTGSEFTLPIAENPDFDPYSILESENGTLGLITSVQNVEVGLLQAKLWFGSTEEEVAPADANNLNAAASQLSFEEQGERGILATMDFEATVAKAAGRNTSVAPYQLIFPVYIQATQVEPTNIVKFVASYGLRGNAQAELELIGLSSLPENLRLIAKSVVSQGLPEPEFTKEQLEQFGLTE